jgi:hypothetical protein
MHQALTMIVAGFNAHIAGEYPSIIKNKPQIIANSLIFKIKLLFSTFFLEKALPRPYN